MKKRHKCVKAVKEKKIMVSYLDFIIIKKELKKFKDKKFAAGCSRDVIKTGAEELGWELDELLEKTMVAMRVDEEAINTAC